MLFLEYCTVQSDKSSIELPILGMGRIILISAVIFLVNATYFANEEIM